MNGKHFLIFTIGPVQEFIAEARRTRDLFVGSRLLVELIRAAAEAVSKVNGAEIIYPGDVKQESLPNRFVAFVPAGQVAQACQEAEVVVKDTWTKYAENARAELAKYAPPEDGDWRKIWKRQTGAFPEIYWSVCIPPKSGEVERLLGRKMYSDYDYSAHYTIASLALNARKGMRDFTQTNEQGEKDTLSGTREALHTKGLKADKYWSQVAQGLQSQAGGNPSLLRPDGRERLDAWGTVKRFIPLRDFPEIDRFPSTSSVAAADFRRRIARQAEEQPGILDELEAHRRQIAALGVFAPGDGFAKDGELATWDYDGDLLYDSTFTPQTFDDDYGLKVSEQQLQPARDSLKRLYKAADCRPSTYYAILMMDADGMSDRIAACQSREEHQAISQALGKFANQVPEIVERRFAGRVVYAGGDDVLALLPAVDALPAATALREAFQAAMPGATISAGIALVHHRHPLDAALRAAREAEHAAKSVPDKDALCVYALKRSGEAVRVQAKWKYGDDWTVPELIEKVRSKFDGPLSSKFAYDAHAEARGLALSPSILNQTSHTVPREALESELRRLLTRHLDPKKVETQAQEKPSEAVKRVARTLAEPLARLGEALDTHRGEWEAKWCEEHPGHDPDPFDEDYAPQPGALELGKWLLLARFLAMGGEE
jgi:CRISPR-associated protein Cmr2